MFVILIILIGIYFLKGKLWQNKGNYIIYYSPNSTGGTLSTPPLGRISPKTDGLVVIF